MENPASVADLVGRGLQVGGGPGETRPEVANYRLGESWRALQAELRNLGVDLETEVAAQRLTAEDIADVVAQAAMRVLRNPDGNSEESGSIDDYSESSKKADATQDVYFTAAELRRLSPGAVSGVPMAGSFKYS